MALKYLGVDFENWRLCEWAVKSIQAYKDLHMPDDDIDYSILSGMTKDELIDWLFVKGISADYNQPMTREQIKRMGEKSIHRCYNNIIATHNLVSITTAHGADLGVTDTDRYCYIMTYSFPCQDLSLAGLGKGMSEGSGTRSGMLWEVRRLLEETPNLPQILLMENVTQVHGAKNMDDFLKWQSFLNSLGYKSYWLDMNAKDYGVPQNRDRCFMVSFLGDYYYDFPQPFKLEKRLKDLLEPEVDEKYYLSQEALKGFVLHKQKQEEQGNSFHAIIKNPNEDESASTIKARYYKDGSDCLTEEEVPRRICNIYGDKFGTGYAGNVWDKEGLCPALMTMEGGNRQPMVMDEPFVDVLGNYSPSGHEASRIISEDGIAPTFKENHGTVNAVAINEPFICASRGRNEQNPSDRTKGIELHQRLEPNYSGCSNTLTSVDKDNYVVIPNDYYVSDKGVRYITDPNRGMATDVNADVSQPITAKGQSNWTGSFISPDIDHIEKSTEIGGNDPCKIVMKDGTQYVNNGQDIVPTPKKMMRVRKLTPRECFRLMGVRDEDFDNVRKNQSDSSLYHLAGDSIVVDCLMEIFKMML